jgi:psp operon transcriptional activator
MPAREQPAPTVGEAQQPSGLAAPPPVLPANLQGVIAEIEQRYLRQALTQARFRQREAAALLGLTYDQFRGLYRKFQNVVKDESPPADA